VSCSQAHLSLEIQGRPNDDAAFALGSIPLEKGGDVCTFFLEGKGDMPDDR